MNLLKNKSRNSRGVNTGYLPFLTQQIFHQIVIISRYDFCNAGLRNKFTGLKNKRYFQNISVEWSRRPKKKIQKSF